MFLVVAFVLLLLVAASALFSAIETALFSLQPFHIERLKARKADFATALSRLMENPRRLLSAILITDALVNLPLIVLALHLIRRFTTLVPFWLEALLIFTLIVFICDLVPKLLARAQPERVARVGVRVMSGIMPVIDPLARVLQRWSERAADALTPRSFQPTQFLSEDELETLVQLSAEEGALHETESEMIQEIIKLGDKTAKDCMTPRVDAFSIPDDLTPAELLPILRARRYRRVPVYGDTPDDVLGVLDVPDFLLAPDVAPYTERLAPPSFVPETMKAIDLLRRFLAHPQGLAVVVDEHGGMEGIVTLADLIEEIISDAVPQADHALYIEPLGGGKLLVNGSARIDDINESLRTELEQDGIDTIGGLVWNRLGQLPKPGAQLRLPGLTLTIRRTSRKRIEEILIQQDTPDTGDDEDPAP